MNNKAYACVEHFLYFIENNLEHNRASTQYLFLIFINFSFFFNGWSQEFPLPQSLEEVYVTSSRFELSNKEVGKSIIKITSKEIEQNQGLTIAQLLNTQVGLTINGNYGQAGSTLSTNIRGGRNRQVLIVIDGVPVNDASQIENNFDLNLIGLEQIEFIEILKGASSVLYGSNASSAVINIVTKKSFKQDIGGTLSSIIGTNNITNQHRHEVHEMQNVASIHGSYKKLSFNSSFSHRFSDGLSALSPENPADNFDEDDFKKTNLYLKLGYTFSKRFSLSTYFNSDRYDSDFDESFGFTDADYNTKNKQERVGVSSVYDYESGSLNLNAAFNNNNRSYDSSYPTKYASKTRNVDVFNKYEFASKLFSLVGVSYNNTEMESYNIPFGSTFFQSDIRSDLANTNSFAPYVNIVYVSKSGLNVDGGVRLNQHSTYGSHLVYSVNPFYSFQLTNQNLKLSASYSTAFITPSLYQLFAPNIGNTLLDPQEDSTLEFGLELSDADVFNLRMTVFQRIQNNFIDYVVSNPTTFEGNYQNILGETTVQGLEAEFKYIGFKHISMNFNYAFVESKEQQLIRIPKHKFNFSTFFDLTDKTNLLLNFQYNSKRISPFQIDSAAIILEAYSLLNMGVAHHLFNDKLKIFANVSNVFDESYQEAYRYSTLGRNYRLGVNFSF